MCSLIQRNPMLFKDNIILDYLRKHNFYVFRSNYWQKEGGFLLLILFGFFSFFSSFLLFSLIHAANLSENHSSFCAIVLLNTSEKQNKPTIVSKRSLLHWQWMKTTWLLVMYPFIVSFYGQFCTETVSVFPTYK